MSVTRSAERAENELDPRCLRKRQHDRACEPQAAKDRRIRKQTAETKEIFKRRELIELIHAYYKNRVPERLTVRGSIKIQTIALRQALANNITAASIRPVRVEQALRKVQSDRSSLFYGRLLQVTTRHRYLGT